MTLLLVFIAVFGIAAPKHVFNASDTSGSWVSSNSQKIYKGDSEEKEIKKWKGTSDKNEDPGIMEGLLIDLLNVINNWIKDGTDAIGLNLDNVVLGRVGGNGVNVDGNRIALYTFEMENGNPYGIASMALYNVIRGVIYILLICIIMGRFVWTLYVGNSASAIATLKESVKGMFLGFVLLLFMPYILGVVLYIRDVLLSAILNAEQSTLGLKNPDFNSMFEDNAEKSFMCAAMWTGSFVLTLFFAGQYVGNAMSMVVNIIAFPFVCLNLQFDKNALTTWFKQMLSCILIPIVDACLLMIPALFGSLSNAFVMQIVQFLVCTMLIPARRELRLAFGIVGNTGMESLGGMAAVLGAGALGKGLWSATGGKVVGAGKNIVSNFKEAKNLEKSAQMDIDLDNADKGIEPGSIDDDIRAQRAKSNLGLGLSSISEKMSEISDRAKETLSKGKLGSDSVSDVASFKNNNADSSELVSLSQMGYSQSGTKASASESVSSSSADDSNANSTSQTGFDDSNVNSTVQTDDVNADTSSNIPSGGFDDVIVNDDGTTQPVNNMPQSENFSDMDDISESDEVVSPETQQARIDAARQKVLEKYATKDNFDNGQFNKLSAQKKAELKRERAKAMRKKAIAQSIGDIAGGVAGGVVLGTTAAAATTFMPGSVSMIVTGKAMGAGANLGGRLGGKVVSFAASTIGGISTGTKGDNYKNSEEPMQAQPRPAGNIPNPEYQPETFAMQYSGSFSKMPDSAAGTEVSAYMNTGNYHSHRIEDNGAFNSGYNDNYSYDQNFTQYASDWIVANGEEVHAVSKEITDIDNNPVINSRLRAVYDNCNGNYEQFREQGSEVLRGAFVDELRSRNLNVGSNADLGESMINYVSGNFKNMVNPTDENGVQQRIPSNNIMSKEWCNSHNFRFEKNRKTNNNFNGRSEKQKPNNNNGRRSSAGDKPTGNGSRRKSGGKNRKNSKK